MTKETRVKLVASAGMIYTDGETYGKEIILAEGNTGESFREITETEYKELLEKQAAETD